VSATTSTPIRRLAISLLLPEDVVHLDELVDGQIDHVPRTEVEIKANPWLPHLGRIPGDPGHRHTTGGPLELAEERNRVTA